MENFLHRIIGEDIALKLVPHGAPLPILAEGVSQRRKPPHLQTGFAPRPAEKGAGRAGWGTVNCRRPLQLTGERKGTAMNSKNGEDSDRRQEMLAAVITVMGQTHGRDVSVYNESFLEKSLEKRREAAACANSAIYLQRLAEDNAEAEAFYCSLRVVYSEFFRNPLAFALLEQLILPGLVEGTAHSRREEIRIWSAGCAAGQEAWSVAILLDELTAAGARPVPYRIFATDLSEGDLDLARRGVYSAAAVGNVRLRHLSGCFSRQGNAYAIAARLQERVDFSLYDLLDGTTTSPPACIYGNFNLVICSNVLLYYRPEVLRLILNKLRRSLAPGGYLITGETERQMVGSVDGFRAVAAHTSVFRRIA